MSPQYKCPMNQEYLPMVKQHQTHPYLQVLPSKIKIVIIVYLDFFQWSSILLLNNSKHVLL
jgi:hypothetical protein